MILIQKILNRLESLMYNGVSVISTLYFNFYHLPFSQAKKLPIYLHKPIFMKEFGGRRFFFHQVGKVVINCTEVTRGMIRLGFIQGASYVDNGFILANYGTIVFKGKCMLAQGSSIRMGGVL